jgi:hypothetical protein
MNEEFYFPSNFSARRAGIGMGYALRHGKRLLPQRDTREPARPSAMTGVD